MNVGFGNERGVVEYLLQEVNKLKDNSGGSSEKGYKELTFSFTGNGTSNPTFIELKNDFSVTFTLSRIGEGGYELTTSENIFPENGKRAIFTSKQSNSYLTGSFDDLNLVVFDNIIIGDSFADFNGPNYSRN